MFEQFFKGTEQKGEMAAEKRQMNFAREQNVTNAGMHPADDRTFLDTQSDKSDLIKWQQELETELFEQVLTFLSLTKDNNGNIINILDEDGNPLDPLCNNLFIQQVVIAKCKPFMNKNLINSKLDEKTILSMQKETHNDIADMMSDNYEKYGISFVNWDGIVRDLKNLITASIWRAHQGWTKKTDSTMSKRIESLVESPHQEGKGLKKLFKT